MTKFFSSAVILTLSVCSLSAASSKASYILNPVLTDFETSCRYDNPIVSKRDSLNPRDIWNNYIRAIGGADNLKKVRDRATIMESHINGQNIVMTIYQKAPDKMKQIITTSSITQNIYFEGGKGVMEIAGKTIDINGSELEKLKYESMINFIINIDSLGIKLNSDGIEKINDKDCYKIEVIFPSGFKTTQYFDIKTWLKVKQIENVTAAKKTFVQETYFGDYREVRGVKYPFSIKESLGTQNLDVVVTSIKINTGLDDSLFINK